MPQNDVHIVGGVDQGGPSILLLCDGGSFPALQGGFAFDDLGSVSCHCIFLYTGSIGRHHNVCFGVQGFGCQGQGSGKVARRVGNDPADTLIFRELRYGIDGPSDLEGPSPLKILTFKIYRGIEHSVDGGMA